ncbi:MAG: transcriptional regulator [Oscillospiraceae bacterium]|nr:transcriptional regulator [Oscillospiraceae bacterium]
MEDSAIVVEMLKCTGGLFFGMKPSHNPMRSMMRGEMFILDYLARKNDTVMPGELSAMMRDGSARTAIALRNLEEKGYIERDIDKTDRRKILVSITEEGRALAREEHEAAVKKMRIIFDELGKEDAMEYIRIVGRVVDITKKLEEV